MTIIQDDQTAFGYLIEFKLMLRFWIALRLGCTRKLLQDYLSNISYSSPLGENTLFAPLIKSTAQRETHEKKQDELPNEPDETATRNQSTQQIGQTDNTDETSQPNRIGRKRRN